MSVTSTTRTIARAPGGSVPGRQVPMPMGDVGSGGAIEDLHLVVRAGGQRIALRMAALRSVVPSPPITRLPDSGPALLGLVALAGELVPVADLATLLDLDPPLKGRRAEPDPVLVVVADGESQLALRVDGVEGHESFLHHRTVRIDLSDEAARAATPLASRVDGEELLALNLDAALADPRLSIADANTPRPGGRK